VTPLYADPIYAVTYQNSISTIIFTVKKSVVYIDLCCLGIFYDTFNSKRHVMPYGMMMSLEYIEESTRGLI
jgi:hypothetical protein